MRALIASYAECVTCVSAIATHFEVGVDRIHRFQNDLGFYWYVIDNRQCRSKPGFGTLISDGEIDAGQMDGRDFFIFDFPLSELDTQRAKMKSKYSDSGII